MVMQNLDQFVPGDAAANQPWRNGLLTVIQRRRNPGLRSFWDGPQVQILGDLSASFSRFAGNQATAFDSGASSATVSGGTNGLEAQVRHAWTKVLGRAPGRGPDSFMQALNAAFPVAADGSGVATAPARSVVSMYSADAVAIPGGGNGSLKGQLPVAQAALFRQASLIASDAQRLLSGLQTSAPAVDYEQFEALRTLATTQVGDLVQEFGRVDEPRNARVQAYLTSLNTTLNQLSAVAQYNNPYWATTDNDTAQLAGFRLLQNYVANLRNAWANYNPYNPNDPVNLSLLLNWATNLLPVVGQANLDFQQAMASVGFAESEQRSVANRFSGLGNVVVPNVALADITPGDLVDWLDSYSTEGLTNVSESGEFGLQFVADQADSIFWAIGPLIYVVQNAPPAGVTQPTLLQVLQNERVGWSLVNLLTQLDQMADLLGPLPVNYN